MMDPNVQAVVNAAKIMPANSPEETVEAYAAQVLGIAPAAAALLQGGQFLDTVVAHLQAEYEHALTEGCEVPSYVVYRPVAGGYRISGTIKYIEIDKAGTPLAARAKSIAAVQAAVDALPEAAYLEALAAALLMESMETARATVLVGDQGVDALGYSSQMEVFWPFTVSTAPLPGTVLGERRFVVASSKRSEYQRGASGPRPALDPHYVRELIGSWVVQRHEQGMWSKHGIKMLSPLQLILVTTYRLSAEARKLCKAMGVDVWMIPQLVYLITRYAPDHVFPVANASTFDGLAFTAWVQGANASRFTKP